MVTHVFLFSAVIFGVAYNFFLSFHLFGQEVAFFSQHGCEFL